MKLFNEIELEKENKRGKIRNRELAQQIRDFSGLRFGKITPTDIDAFVEFGNKVFIFVESKHIGTELPYGQRLGLERIIDAIKESGKDAWLLKAVHDTKEDIDFSKLITVSIYHNKRWQVLKNKKTVREVFDKILEKNNWEIK